MNYSYELQSVIASMLELDPKKRPSTQDLIKIPKVEQRIYLKKLKTKFHSMRSEEAEI